MAFVFDHERLDAYRLAVEVVRWLASTKFPPGNADLRDQALRASRSIALNIAEGQARGGDAGRNHCRIAAGSAAETCAVLDLVDLPGGPEQQEKLRRIGVMLHGLARRLHGDVSKTS
jgi:four helix bundle protein